MEVVLKKDITVTEWPIWNVSRSSTVVLDGNSIADIFSMINRQIEVLRHHSRTHENQITIVLRREDEDREKFDRENSKLHDRIDRLMKLFEQQFSTSSIEQRLKLLEEKLKSVDEQVNLVRESPIQTELSQIKQEREMHDDKLLHLETSRATMENTIQALSHTISNIPVRPSSILGANTHGHAMQNARMNVEAHAHVHSNNHSTAIHSSTHSEHKSISNTQGGIQISPRIPDSQNDPKNSKQRNKSLKLTQRTKHDSDSDSDSLHHLGLIEDLEKKMDGMIESSYSLNERLMQLEGGVIAVDTRLNTITKDTTKNDNTIDFLEQEIYSMKNTLTERIEPRIDRLFSEKANAEDVRLKADNNIVSKKADESHVRRINDLVDELDKKILVLSRDFEEGIEGVQKRHDKKLEFMTQWIVKHVRKGQSMKEAHAETADIGKTRCLVCDQPVREMEKDTPYVAQAFKTTLNELKMDPRRATTSNNNNTSSGKYNNNNNNNSPKNRNNNSNNISNKGNRGRATSPESETRGGGGGGGGAGDPDGPWQQRVYYTGGTPLGATLAAHNNHSYSAVHLSRATGIPIQGMLHVPSTPNMNMNMNTNMNGSNSIMDNIDLGLTNQKLDVDPEWRSTSRPSSAPAVRKDSKHKKAVNMANMS
eukprot:gene426-764_t